MPQNSQQSSVPYEGDVLQPHDQNLIMAIEFGTNTTTDIGTDYNDSTEPPIDASIDARLGMLKLTEAFGGIA